MTAFPGSSLTSVLSYFSRALLRRIPERHLNEHAKDAVQLGVGWILIIAALVPLMSGVIRATAKRQRNGIMVRLHGERCRARFGMRCVQSVDAWRKA
jgi:hypothetical protein